MNSRREFLSLGLASFVRLSMFAQDTPERFGIHTLSTWDLPPINLNGWQAIIRELTFPPGLKSPKHMHPGLVLGYVLQGRFRFNMSDQPEQLLSAGETFYEPPGGIHLASGSASSTEPARVLVVEMGEKGKDFMRLL